jgi:CRP/FNR family transcriptional regulator, dissimilatory nitrate respiration regulator
MTYVVDWLAWQKDDYLLGALPEHCRVGVSRREAAKGHVLFRRGDKPRHLFFVLSGEVRLVRTAIGGSEIVLQRACNGLLAEASLDQRHYHCDAVVAVTADLVAIPRETFIVALNDAGFRNRWTAQLLGELRRVRAHAERLNLDTARERIVHYIEAEGSDGKVVLTQTKKDWSRELGISHETLYRTLAHMHAQGVVHVDGRTVSLRRV